MGMGINRPVRIRLGSQQLARPRLHGMISGTVSQTSLYVSFHAHAGKLMSVPVVCLGGVTDGGNGAHGAVETGPRS